MMKKIVIGITFCIIVTLTFAIFATAQAPADFTYELNNDGITLVKYIGESEKVVIPEKIDGHFVTEIGDFAFSDCNFIKEILFEGEKLKRIGEVAFEGGSKIENIALPYGLQSIGTGAFEACSSLKSISFPSTVTEIGDFAFRNCDPDFTIICIRDSYTEQFAKENNIKYDFVRQSSSLLYFIVLVIVIADIAGSVVVVLLYKKRPKKRR